nr:hypothetical protein [Tanacetum cinerariifolium]
MQRVGKGISGVDTPLFEGMLVSQEVEEGDTDENVENVNDGDATEGGVSAANNEVPTVQPTPPQSPQVQPQSPQPQPQPTQDTGIPMNLLQEVMDTCITLSKRVEHLEFDNIAQALEITKLTRMAKKLERRNKVKVLKLKRLQKVVTTQRVETSDETVMDDVSNQGRMIAEMDQDADGRNAESQAEIYKIDLKHANKVLSIHKEESEPTEVQEVVDIVTTAKLIIEVDTAASISINAAEVPVPAATTAAASTLTAAPRRRTKGVVIRDPEESTTTSTIIHTEAKSKDNGKGILVEEPKPLKKQAQIEQDEKYARKNMTIYLKNVVGFKMDYFKGMPYDDIRPIFEAKFDSNVAFLQNTKEQIEEEEESRALKRINETPAESAAKRQKLDEEVEELKRHLQIVPNEDDDVYTEATSLVRKVPVVGYEIIEHNNKPYYKIIRADAGYTCSNLEESKKCTWSSKSQGLEAVGIIWCADHNIYNHTADFVSGEEVPTYKIHSRSDAKCVNELRAERLARNANPLALVNTAQANQDPYYQISKSYKSYAPSSKPSIPIRTHTTTRYKGKEIAKPITPPSETASKEDSDSEQAQRDKDMQKNLALFAKYFKKIYKPTNNNLRTSSNSRNKNVDMTPWSLGFSVLTARNLDILLRNAESQKGLRTPHTDEEINEQELEAHYSYMAKLQEVPSADTGTDSETLEQVQNVVGYNVFANDLQHSEQSEYVSNTCLVETDDINVIPNSLDMCNDDIHNDQNDVESDDERVALANLKLNSDENKKIQKKLKKANTTLAQKLKECKTILAETSKTLRESNSVRDSYFVSSILVGILPLSHSSSSYLRTAISN